MVFLFRAWRKKLGMSFRFGLGEFPEWEEGKVTLPYWSRMGRCKIQQYTGLKDSEGRRIFEGDIVEFKDENNLTQKGIIEWNKEEFLYRVTFGELDAVGLGDITTSVNKLGNILENPELLGEK